jgi:SAM-dependent methyltransferase
MIRVRRAGIMVRLANSFDAPQASHYRENGIDHEMLLQVILVDYLELINGYEWRTHFTESQELPIRLLDLGSLTGLVPHLLLKKRLITSSILYDYLDPIPDKLFSIREKLSSPMVPNKAICSHILEFALTASTHRYNYIWALQGIHYHPEKLKEILAALRSHLKSEGKLLIYQPTADSFYAKCFEASSRRRGADAMPRGFTTAEQISEVAQSLGYQVSSTPLSFFHPVPRTNEKLLGSYLSLCSQWISSYFEWLSDQEVHSLIESFRYEKMYAFPQTRSLIECIQSE